MNYVELRARLLIAYLKEDPDAQAAYYPRNDQDDRDFWEVIVTYSTVTYKYLAMVGELIETPPSEWGPLLTMHGGPVVPDGRGGWMVDPEEMASIDAYQYEE